MTPDEKRLIREMRSDRRIKPAEISRAVDDIGGACSRESEIRRAGDRRRKRSEQREPAIAG